MRKRVHVSLLASMIGVGLFGGASITAVTAAEFTLSKHVSESGEAKTYLIEFQEQCALNYKGGIA